MAVVTLHRYSGSFSYQGSIGVWAGDGVNRKLVVCHLKRRPRTTYAPVPVVYFNTDKLMTVDASYLYVRAADNTFRASVLHYDIPDDLAGGTYNIDTDINVAIEYGVCLAYVISGAEKGPPASVFNLYKTYDWSDYLDAQGGDFIAGACVGASTYVRNTPNYMTERYDKDGSTYSATHGYRQLTELQTGSQRFGGQWSGTSYSAAAAALFSPIKPKRGVAPVWF